MTAPRPNRAPRPARPSPPRRPGPPRALVAVLVVTGGVILLVIAMFWLLAPRRAATGTPGTAGPTTVTPFKADENVGQRQPVETGTHIPTGTAGHWASLPPSSGQHWPAPAPWGPAQQALPPERWVHNLEHGGVVVLFRDAADAGTAAAFARGAPQESAFGEVKVVDAPYPQLGSRFALVAWGWVDSLDSWDAAEALRFYAAHVDRGPENIP